MADAPSSRAVLHQLIDTLPEEQIPAALAALTQVGQDALRSTSASIPGLRPPAQWPPRYPTVEPIDYDGELASEQLIRERRLTIDWTLPPIEHNHYAHPS